MSDFEFHIHTVSLSRLRHTHFFHKILDFQSAKVYFQYQSVSAVTPLIILSVVAAMSSYVMFVEYLK